MSTPELQAVEREMAPKLAAFGDQIVQNEKLFARIAAVYEHARELRPHPRAAAPGLARLHQLRARRREARRRRRRSALSEINQRLATLFTAVQPERAGRRDRLRPGARHARPTSPGLPRLAARRRRRRRRGARARRQVGDPQHALVDGAVPDLLRPPRPAREGLAHLLQPRRQRRRARQQRRHHRDPEAARRAGQAARLSDPRPLAARERDGEDARSARWS